TLAAVADAELRKHQCELVGERACRRGDEAFDRPEEADTRLDRDGEQIERVRQFAADLSAPNPCLAEQHVAGCEEARRTQGDAEEQRSSSEIRNLAGRDGREHAERRYPRAEGEKRLRRDAPGKPCRGDPLRERFAELPAGETRADRFECTECHDLAAAGTAVASG